MVHDTIPIIMDGDSGITPRYKMYCRCKVKILGEKDEVLLYTGNKLVD